MEVTPEALKVLARALDRERQKSQALFKELVRQGQTLEAQDERIDKLQRMVASLPQGGGGGSLSMPSAQPSRDNSSLKARIDVLESRVGILQDAVASGAASGSGGGGTDSEAVRNLAKNFVHLREDLQRVKLEMEEESTARRMSVEQQKRMAMELHDRLRSIDSETGERIAAVLANITSQIITDRESIRHEVSAARKETEKQQEAIKQAADESASRALMTVTELKRSLDQSLDSMESKLSKAEGSLKKDVANLKRYIRRELESRDDAQAVLKSAVDSVALSIDTKLRDVEEKMDRDLASLADVVREEVRARMEGETTAASARERLTQGLTDAIETVRQRFSSLYNTLASDVKRLGDSLMEKLVEFSQTMRDEMEKFRSEIGEEVKTQAGKDEGRELKHSIDSEGSLHSGLSDVKNEIGELKNRVQSSAEASAEAVAALHEYIQQLEAKLDNKQASP